MNWTSLVKSYLDQRRELGYQLNSEEQQLLNFASYADEKNFSQPLTIPLACEWASLAPSGSAIAIARRTSALRPFSRYLSFINPAYPVLPSRLMGPTHRRLPPFIYSNNDIDGLLAACSSLFTITGLRPITMHTLIGLLLTTGLRPGEGVRLKNDNVNLNSGELIINNSKGWRCRIIPIMESTIKALTAYQDKRNQLIPVSLSDAFFVTDKGKSMNIMAADYSFKLLRKQLKLENQNNSRSPRLYDLRHTFVCRRVLSWYKENVDINCVMPQLAQYLGHKKIGDTYWYIQSTPALMECATFKFNRYLDNAGGRK